MTIPAEPGAREPTHQPTPEPTPEFQVFIAADATEIMVEEEVALTVLITDAPSGQVP
ncbi:MAG: hypothetical protein OXF79_00955 [Chloroflexi bacterium]|nr:hypothetical protein [Chloroflexota bacterium]